MPSCERWLEVVGRGLADTDSWVAEQIRLLGLSDLCREAPLFTERTSVGLDVHARSVAAAAIDGVTGELVRARLRPAHEEIRSWVQGLPGPVAVAYEADRPASGCAVR